MNLSFLTVLLKAVPDAEACYNHHVPDCGKASKPHGNAVDNASEMGIEVLTEDQYRMLQALSI